MGKTYPPDETRLLKTRLAFGLTLAESATILQVPPQTLSKWEKGIIDIDQKSRERICRVMNVSPEWITSGKAFPFRDCGIVKMEPRRRHDRHALELLELAISKSSRCDAVIYPGYAGSWIHFVFCTLTDGTVRIITLCKSNGSIIAGRNLSEVAGRIVWHGKITPLRTEYNRLNVTVLGDVIHSIKNDLCILESFLDGLTQKRGRGQLIEKHVDNCSKAIANIRLSVESKLRLFK